MKQAVKNQIKVFGVATLVTLGGVSTLFARETDTLEVVSYPTLTYEFNGGMSYEEWEPRTNYLALDNVSISTTSNLWDQSSGFAYARVYVKNDRNGKLKLTLRSPAGKVYAEEDIAANGSITLLVSNASTGAHKASFSSPSGSISGTITVRVSDLPLD